jgi:hypothetical protein
MNLIRKYAKDLNPGDKYNGHTEGWITVIKRKRLSYFTELTILKATISDTPEMIIIDSHEIFDSVIVP